LMNARPRFASGTLRMRSAIFDLISVCSSTYALISSLRPLPDLPLQLANPFFEPSPRRRKLVKREGPIPPVKSSSRSSLAARGHFPREDSAFPLPKDSIFAMRKWRRGRDSNLSCPTTEKLRGACFCVVTSDLEQRTRLIQY
jgi:hypothetical protein